MFLELCNTLALYGILSSWCVDPQQITPVIPHPDKGTVLQTSCSGTTLLEEIADGNGNSTTVATENSEQCGYTATPPYGTLLREGCSQDYPGVKWFQYADGEGGTYSEKDNKSRECGWKPPVLVLETDKFEGDRFDPAVVYVNYTDFLGNNEPWGMVHASSTIGRLERDGDYILIYGDGRTGDGILTLGRQEIQFRIEEEPVCEVDTSYVGGGGIDCEGFKQRTGQDLIYYGEDDDKVVTWELGVFVYASHRTYGIDQPIGIMEEWDETHPQWDKWQKRVDQYNEVYEKSGVHIRYNLTKLYLAHWHSVMENKNLATGLPVDVVLGYGTSYPDTCGVAKVTTYFAEGKPPASMSKCSIYTDLHEIGHSVGLAHGPENQSNEASGYIFPEYGHGWNDICYTKDDLMSYGRDGVFHSNSKLDCSDIFEDSERYNGWPAGGTQWSDTAKALNRVRYDVSLIHREHDYVEENPRLQKMYSRSVRKEIEVID